MLEQLVEIFPMGKSKENQVIMAPPDSKIDE